MNTTNIPMVGILGMGFVGSAIHAFFPNAKTYDKYKGNQPFETILATDILYLCLPTLFIDSSYDMTEVDDTLEKLSEARYTGVILVKSTVLPLYCSTANAKYPDLKIVHNPEFLTARTAAHDFAQQSHVVLGYTGESCAAVPIIETFYRMFFPKANISVVNAEVSALMKLTCNSFYAVKVQFFTEIYLLCEHMGISYEQLKELILKNKWVNPNHTTVPGPDGKISFGGACLPKDIKALNAFLEELQIPNKILEASIQERNTMRE